MKTLLISDRWHPDTPIPNFDASTWQNRPSVEGYPIVILDLYFGEATEKEGFYPSGGRQFNFYELGAEVTRCLRAGGVVIALLGPVAVTERSLHTQDYMRTTLNLKHSRQGSGPIPPPQLESSYDWLDQGFLKTTGLDKTHSRRSDGISWFLPDMYCPHYSYQARKYWLTIGGVEQTKRKTEGVLTWRMEESDRWETIQPGDPCTVKILGEGANTHLPVAAAVNYLGLGGLLLLMPPFLPEAAPDQSAAKTQVAFDLQSIGQHFREQIKAEAPKEHPEWVLEHRAPPAKRLSEEVKEAERRIEELSHEQAKYDHMLDLLDGTGKPLQDSVLRIFGPEWLGFAVTPTPAGADLDMFVTDPATNRTLAVEVTGIGGKFNKNDQHLSDVLSHLPEHEERNQNGRIERIVLAVNTFKDTAISSRNHSEDFTSPAQSLAKKNQFLLIRTYDLYRLWVDFVEKRRTARDIFDLLFSSEGVFKYQPIA